jgi:23S rRNA (pseudouridine1915-N3)-methyltransferase
VKVQLIAVGNKMPSWVIAGYDEYAKRLPKELTPQLIELPIGHRSKNGVIADAIKSEGEAILQAALPQSRKVMLEVKGKAWSTEQFAEQIADWRMQGDNLSFVIGGPNGLSAACLAQADALWSLSNLTLPHPLVRIVFIEQLYRAWTLLQGHPYHK